MKLSDYIIDDNLSYHINDKRETATCELQPVHVHGDVKFSEKFEFDKLTKKNLSYLKSDLLSFKKCLLFGRSIVVDIEKNEIVSSSILNGRFFCEKKWLDVEKKGFDFSVKLIANSSVAVSEELQNKRCAFMLGNTGSYQHWFMEILPLLAYYKELLDNKQLDCILVNSDAPSYQLDVYKLLGVYDKIFFTDEKKVYLLNNLVIGIPLSINSIWINPEIIKFFDWIKNRLLINHIAPETEKIIIGRADLAKKREIKNFSKIENIALSYGYRTVYPERMSLYEKIKLFSSCKKIIGQAGGGMSHLVFSNLLETSIMLAPNNFPINTFREICSFKNVECVYFLTESFDNFCGGKLDSNSYADLSEFNLIMKKYG
ncbi:glycosyltransferase family 61 protein [Comamonas terrigena]|uniref:glycosyltransferase family 61 protein n=1 Tax=Comamonas terrigena TaxID=32013 RepID=UPI00289DECB4|nr:glycosyltransferase family 61 protein [Comamonas terrigena]